MCAEPRDVGRLRPERMLSAEVGTGGDSSRHERGSSRHDGANRGLLADEPLTCLANRLATGLALEVAATSVPSPSVRRASAIGSERERDIGGVRETKDEPLETRAELPSSIELGDLELGEITAPSSIELGKGSLDVGALFPASEPCKGWVEGALPSSMEWDEDGGLTRGAAREATVRRRHARRQARTVLIALLELTACVLPPFLE